MLLKPEILNQILNNNKNIKRAKAIINNNWASIYNQNPLMINKITINDIKLAKIIVDSKVIQSKINFNDFNSIHGFIINNDKYLDNGAKNFLLKSFN